MEDTNIDFDTPEPRQNADVDGTLQRIIKSSAFMFFQIVFAEFLKNENFGEIQEVKPIRETFRRKGKLELDSLFEVINTIGYKYFFNVEFQSVNDPGFLIRLHEYYSSFMQYIFNILGPEVKIRDYPRFFQVGLYVGDKPMTMDDSFQHMDNKYSIKLIDIRTLKSEDFLNSKNPQMIVIAILVYQHVDEEAACKVIKKLEELNLEKSVLVGYVKDVLELSIKRHARGTVLKQIEQMHYETKELILSDVLYQEGVSVGLEAGKKEGKLEGLEEGEKKGLKLAKFATAKMMIKKGYPIEEIQLLNNLSDTEWQEFLKSNQDV